MKKTFILFALLLTSQFLNAQTTKEELFSHRAYLGSNYCPYPDSLIVLTPAPKGYEAFYISHFGRHGSRYMASNNPFHDVINAMDKAKKDGKLTPLGKQVLNCVQKAYKYASGKGGDLSLLGQHQHQNIANRMYQNYPVIFQDSNIIDARSTLVDRAQASMEFACAELQRLNPKLKIIQRTRAEDKYFMSPSNDSIKDKKSEKKVRQQIELFMDSLRHVPQAHLHLFKGSTTYKKYFKDYAAFNNNLYNILQDTLCLPEFKADFPKIFTDEELFDIWESKNMQWAGYLGLIHGTHPDYMKMVPTVKNIIREADKMINSGKSGASLRYGHDSQIYPLSYLMGLSDNPPLPKDMALEDLYKYTSNSKIIPMAANIQLVFYRKSGSNDILVKALLQEKEQHLPVATNQWPYYHWQDVKKYWQEKIKR